MSEKQFQIIHLGNPYEFVVKDNTTNKTYGPFEGDEKSMSDLLNEQQFTIESERDLFEKYKASAIRDMRDYSNKIIEMQKKVDEQQATINKLTTKCSRLAKEKDELSDEIGQLNYDWSDKVGRFLCFVEEQGQVSRQQIKEWWNDECV